MTVNLGLTERPQSWSTEVSSEDYDTQTNREDSREGVLLVVSTIKRSSQ